MTGISRAKRTARRRSQRTAGALGWENRIPAPLRRWLRDELAPVGRTLGAAPVLALLLLTLPVLLLVYQFPRPHRIDVGGDQDDRYVRGFYPPEVGSGTDFRWTDDDVKVVVPAAPGNSAWTATFRISATRPPNLATPPTMDVLADGRLVARLDIVPHVDETTPTFQDYTVRFTREPLPADDLALNLKVSTFDPPGDPRKLGVAIDEITLAPERTGPARPLFPPPVYAAMFLLLLVGVAGLLGRLGVAPRAVAAVLLIALGALGAGELRQPDVTAWYVPGLLLIAAALAVLLLGLRPLVRRLYAAGGVALAAREEQLLLGIFAFGVATHLAGVFFPGFQAHDLKFQTNRLSDVLHGHLLLSVLSSEAGYRLTPYPPALYVLLAPFAALAKDLPLTLRLLPPIVDATSVFLIFYLLRRCRVPDPAPLLGAFFYTLIPATYQLLWWGFFPNLFGQWATLAAVTLAVAHYADLARPRFFAALVVLLCLALLSHPGTFVLTLALVPLLALALAATVGRGGDRRGALALLAALGVACGVVYALYYRHFTGLVGEQIRSWLADTSAVSDAPTDRGWEDDYIRNRLFTLPFAAYFAAAWVAGLALLYRGRRAEPGDDGEGDAPSRGGRRALGWLLIAILTTASLFAAAHVLTGVWVRYFVFTTPALAIGAALVVAWLTLRGRWGRALAYAAFAYCTAATFLFWLSVTVGSARSPYP